MNTTDAVRFQQGVDQAQTGQKAAAYATFTSLHNFNSTDPNLLLWLAFTSPDLAESERLLGQVARFDPQSASLPGAWQWLRTERANRVVVSPAPPRPSLSGTVPTPPVAQAEAWPARPPETNYDAYLPRSKPSSGGKIWFFVVPVALVFVGLGLWIALSGGTLDTGRATNRNGGPARDFTLQNLQGRTVSLKDYRGKAVMLKFWTTW